VPQINLLSITARRAELLALVSRHQTQTQIATAMDIAPATVKSHLDWLRNLTNLGSMRELGDWWQHSRRAWLCEHAAVAGLDIGPEMRVAGRGTEPMKMGPYGRTDTLVPE